MSRPEVTGTQRILALARLDLADVLRSRWLLLCVGLYAVLAALFVLVGMRESGVLGFTGMGRVLLSLCHALLLLLPLLALTGSGQVVNRAREDGTLELLFSHPVDRRDYFTAVTTVRFLSLFAPLLLLLFTAQLYSRTLSMTGITGAAKEFFLASGLGPYEVLTVMVLMWFLLGCLVDSISIILLTVPVFAPIAQAMGFDPIAFAIMGILAIETGLLTPPFGLLVFTVKAVLPNEASVGEIFRAVIPYWICLLGVIVALAVYPQLATWLPSVGIN